MKPVSLECEGFGAFRDKQTIDFTILRENGLFLITGPTGSGKSTIFDALCFALYGKPSSADRESTLKSDFLPEDGKGSVRFVFEIRGKQYEAFRAVSNGKSKISLSPLPGREYTLIKAAEFNEKIVSLIGFGYDQFTKVVMLPQGKFQELLFAPDETKSALFRQIFRTGLYERVEFILKARSAGAAKEVEKITNELSGLLLDQEAGSREGLRELFEEAENEWKDKNLEFQEQENKNGEFEKRRDHELKILQSFKDYELAEKQSSVLLAQKSDMDIKRKIWTDAESAVGVNPSWMMLKSKNDDLKKSHEESRMAEVTRNAMQMALAESEKELSLIDPMSLRKDKITEELVKLDSGLTAVLSAEKITLELEEQKSIGDALKKRLLAFEMTIPTRKIEIEKLRKTIEEGTLLAGRKEAVTLMLADVEKQLSSWRAIRVSEDNQISLGHKILDAQKVTEENRNLLTNLEKMEKEATVQFLENSAIVLAQDLRIGLPCPVCGSTDHPAPAEGDRRDFSLSSLDEIREKTLHQRAITEESVKSLSELTNAYDALRSTWTAQTGSLDDEKIIGQKKIGLEQELKKIEKAVFNVEGLRQDMDAAVAELIRDETEYKSVGVNFQETEKQIASWEAQRKTLLSPFAQGASAAHIRQQIISLSEEQKQIEVRITAIREKYSITLKNSASAFSGLEAAVKHQEEMTHKQKVASESFNIELLKAGFKSPEDFTAALLPFESVAALLKEIRNYEDGLLTSTAKKNELEKRILGVKKPDEDALEQERLTNKSRTDALSAECGMLKQKKENLQKKIKTGDKLFTELEKAKKMADNLEFLYYAAAGKTGKRIPFSNYVQASLLDDVLMAANTRFDKMSKGRFSFRRTDEKAHRKQSAGLEIVIFDQYTATERPAKSLSGGESFMASLSLAMGLSDTVQNYSGGVTLDTVFIDEGFGSLDPDTLDSALMVLSEMIPRGGLVGIISHVSELKERIPAKIQVFKGREGSTLRVEV